MMSFFSGFGKAAQGGEGVVFAVVLGDNAQTRRSAIHLVGLEIVGEAHKATGDFSVYFCLAISDR